MTETPTRPRLLTGDRPTGKLHIGHLYGSLENRVRLQDDYDTILIIADLHMLTTKRSPDDIAQIAANTRAIVLDYLAAGIDPDKTTIYLQSAIAETYELNTLLSNFVSVNRLSRLPSIKDMAAAAKMDDASVPVGLLCYPVLQAADILLPRARIVPVGRDNEAHIEITREIARRFNHTYGPVFPEPESLIGGDGALPGTDNKGKMSKSAGNAIFISDDAATVARKIRKMYTDPKRIHADIPGTVEGNPVFAYHRAFNDDQDEVNALAERYRAGTVGDGEVKARLVAAMERKMAPLRARRAHYESQPGLVDEVIFEGTLRMREIARDTMREVRKAMGVAQTFKKISRSVERRRKKAARARS